MADVVDDESKHPAEGLDPKAAYDLGRQHQAAAGVSANPFDTPPVKLQLGPDLSQSIPRVSSDGLTGNPKPPATTVPDYSKYPAPGSQAPPTAQDKAITQQSDEAARRSAGISRVDWSQRPGGVADPFTNGFFNPRSPLAQIPRTPQAPVGGTVAVVDTDTGPNGNTRTNSVRPVGAAGTLTTNPDGSNQLTSPFGNGRTTFGGAPGTRRPFIAGANGENVAGDFVAGGRFSSAPAGSDSTLDKNYVAGLPRRRNQTALVSRPRRSVFAGAY